MKKYLNFLEGEKDNILEQHKIAIKKSLLKEDEPSLPDKTILGTGPDKYDYKREKGRYFTKQKNATSWNDITGTKYEQPIRQGIFKDVTTLPISTSNKSVTSSKVPFTNRTEGDKFRQWVNKNYPSVAKNTALNPTSQYFNNVNIINAWNSKIGNQTLGSLYMGEKPEIKDVKTKQTSDEYVKGLEGYLWKTDPIASKEYGKFSQSEPDVTGAKAVRKREIELMDPNKIPQWFKGNADRINKEVFYIKENDKNFGKPFLIIDPRLFIVAAFDAKYNLVNYSQTIKGADPELEKPMTYDDWCQISGKYAKRETTNYFGQCVFKDKLNDYKKLLLQLTKGSITKQQFYSKLKDKNNKISGISYDALIDTQTRAFSPGIYSVGTPYYTKGYEGEKDIPNTAPLRTQGLLGSELGTAIHALVRIDDRLKLDDKLKSLLKKEKEFGNIPKQYTQEVTKMIESGKPGLSSGCFNVDPKFIQDPKVQEILKVSPSVFVMSEKEDYYLVQVLPKDTPNYFEQLRGDGENCKNPTALALNVGGERLT